MQKKKKITQIIKHGRHLNLLYSTPSNKLHQVRYFLGNVEYHILNKGFFDKFSPDNFLSSTRIL